VVTGTGATTTIECNNLHCWNRFSSAPQMACSRFHFYID
jgi:hypothetical protein